MTKWTMSAKNFSILVTLSVYMLFYGIWTMGMETTYIESYAAIMFPWVAVSIIVQLCCFMLIKKVSMTDVGLWFVLLSYLFMYGYLFVEVFDLQSSLLWMPIKEYGQDTLFHAASFVNLSLNMFSLGYLLLCKPERDFERVSDYGGQEMDAVKYQVGLLLCAIGGICQLITSGTLVAVTQTAGSYTAYSQAASAGLVDDIAFLFVPGVLCILVSGKLSRPKAFMLTAAVVVYFSAIMLLSGSRKTQVFAILAVVLCFLHSHRPVKFKMHIKLLFAAAGTVFLNMIYIIRENRMNLSRVVPAFVESLMSLDFLKHLVPEILAETGITFCSVASVVKCVPEVFPFEYGTTVLRSIVSILPIGWLIPDFFAKASTTTTINPYLSLPVGSSLLGDFYWNWGMFGIVAALVFGMALAAVSAKLRKRSDEVYFSVFYIVLLGVRAGMFEILRPLFLVAFVPWLLSCMMKRKTRGE